MAKTYPVRGINEITLIDRCIVEWSRSFVYKSLYRKVFALVRELIQNKYNLLILECDIPLHSIFEP